MSEDHNPQFFIVSPNRPPWDDSPVEPTNIRKPHRLLTVEEFAVLHDVQDESDAAAAVRLFEHLQPELYHEGKCEWTRVKALPLLASMTFRTKAPPLPTRKHIGPDFARAGADFAESFDYLASAHHDMMKEKGFWKDRNAIVAACAEVSPELAEAAQAAIDHQAIALMHTELSEMAESVRDGSPPDDKIPAFPGPCAELADVILRGMDLAAARGWQVGEALVDKIQMNATREYKHGRNC
jgi:hypothetical protein